MVRTTPTPACMSRAKIWSSITLTAVAVTCCSEAIQSRIAGIRSLYFPLSPPILSRAAVSASIAESRSSLFCRKFRPAKKPVTASAASAPVRKKPAPPLPLFIMPPIKPMLLMLAPMLPMRPPSSGMFISRQAISASR